MKNNQKNAKKSIYHLRVSFFILNSPPLTRDVTCFKLWKYGENIGDKKLLLKHTL